MGASSILPNPDLFVAMYVRQEAVLSSQIEGTQSTLQDVLQLAIAQKIGGSNYGLRLLDLLFEQPIVNVRLVENYLQCAYVTASKIVDQFMDLGLLHEVTGWQRNRLYRYEPYPALFEPLIPVAAD